MTFPFAESAALILERRYLARHPEGGIRETPLEMLMRVAGAVAAAEAAWGGESLVRSMEKRFLELLVSGLFLPNSPTLMNAGRPLGQLSACFVLPVEDNLESIFQTLKETALIHQSGGGTGFSFSRLRPAGDLVRSTLGVSSGPVSFMHVYDVATEAVKQGGTRRGANMGMLHVSHPDVEEFIRAKQRPGYLENFNLSVMVNRAFMEAALAGGKWPLVNPRTGRAVREVEAGLILDLLVDSAHRAGEPGLAFEEPINQANPTPHLGRFEATNPCGEQPLLPHESCNLGSLVLPRFLRDGNLDWAALEEAAALAVRFLDDVIEVNRFPLSRVARATLATRKVGLGVMGLADLLADLSLPYDSPRAAALGREIMVRIGAAARQASQDLGRERGSFPAFGQSSLAAHHPHMRNATVTTVAPTGTLSLLMGCSSGIEPYFALAYTRRLLDGHELTELNPRFLARLREKGLDTPENLTALRRTGQASAVKGLDGETRRVFATSHELPPRAHLEMQAAFQAGTDNGVSKTVNLPAQAEPGVVREVFIEAHRLGLKGVTAFRHGSRGSQVLELAQARPGEPARQTTQCPRCGRILAYDGTCRVCADCGASDCD